MVAVVVTGLYLVEDWYQLSWLTRAWSLVLLCCIGLATYLAALVVCGFRLRDLRSGHDRAG